MDENTLFYTPYQISLMFGISYHTALEWIKNSGIRYTKVGKKYLVPKNYFNALTDSQNFN